MQNSSDAVIRSVLGLNLDQKALIIRTPAGNNIITRYYYKKTPLKNLLKTLIEKVGLTFKAGNPSKNSSPIANLDEKMTKIKKTKILKGNLKGTFEINFL